MANDLEEKLALADKLIEYKKRSELNGWWNKKFRKKKRRVS
jgi:hypothetical protein